MLLCVCDIMATNFWELATTLTYVGAKWLPEKKVNFTPCKILHISVTCQQHHQSNVTGYGGGKFLCKGGVENMGLK